jgi:hypothetical protein
MRPMSLGDDRGHHEGPGRLGPAGRVGGELAIALFKYARSDWQAWRARPSSKRRGDPNISRATTTSVRHAHSELLASIGPRLRVLSSTRQGEAAAGWNFSRHPTAMGPPALLKPGPPAKGPASETLQVSRLFSASRPESLAARTCDVDPLEGG